MGEVLHHVFYSDLFQNPRKKCVEILSDYVQYSILILRLGLEYTFLKSYTNTLVISNEIYSHNNVIMYIA